MLRLDYKCVQHTNVWLLKHLLRKLLVARQHYQAELCISKLLVSESYQCQGCKYIDLHAYLTFHMQTSRSHSFFQIPAGKTTMSDPFIFLVTCENSYHDQTYQDRALILITPCLGAIPKHCRVFASLHSPLAAVVIPTVSVCVGGCFQGDSMSIWNRA